MNRTILSVLVVGLIVMAGYVVMTRSATAPSETITPPAGENDSATNTIKAATTPRSEQGTFADVVARGGSGQCTFSDTTDDATSEGEFWFADGAIRVESMARVNGEVYTSNMINNGEQIYIWGGTAEGMQAVVLDATTTDANYSYPAAQTDARVDMNQAVAYTCVDWTPAAAQFVPPGDIEFVDMNAVMSGYFDGELRGVPEGMDF